MSRLKLLIIEPDERWRAWLRQHVTVVWPHADFTELSADTAAALPEEFAGADFDLILLTLSDEPAQGLDWLRRYAGRSGFPPVVALAAGGDEWLAVQAIKAGAEDYLPRTKLRHEGLVRALRTALDARRGVATGRPPGDSPGPRLPRGWRVLRRLHASDVSTVLLAERDGGGEQRVFKLFHGQGDEVDPGVLYQRFLQEYQSIAGLDHPNVVRIHDIGVDDSQSWIAMEYLPGGTLAARIAEGMSPAEALAAARDIARGLTAVHALGVLHRDLKPANVMRREDGRWVLIDFGLAKEMRAQSAVTSPGMIFGTPWYMSPEQGHGGPVDERSDCYSLGVMLYEMLTGSRPFSARTPMALVYQHRNAPRPALPPALAPLEPLVHRMMAAEPGDRFESAGHLLMALGE